MEVNIKKLVLILIFISSVSFARGPIIVGSKQFTESVIITELVAILLEEKYSVQVTRKHALGGTQVAFEGLQSDGIHIYPEYTGTGYIMILKESGITNSKIMHEFVSEKFKKDYGITWSKPLGFNNTYAVSVDIDDIRYQEVTKISQLKKLAKDIKIGSSYEFMERPDGFKKFADFYKLDFQKQNIYSMEAGLMYPAIKDKQVDFIINYSTDGRIKTHNLRILEDDEKFFPPYEVALITKTSTLELYPELKNVFSDLEGNITESEMVFLNNLVDGLKQEPKDVALNFLISKNLIKGKKKKIEKTKDFFSFLMSKRSYLVKILIEHIWLSFWAMVIAILISVPMGVLMAKKDWAQKVFFPLINTSQTIPSLALLGALIPFFGIGFTTALIALVLYSLLPLARNTYTGIIRVEKNIVEAAKGMGLTDLQILFRVELPLALPVILAGVRTAAVIVIGITTIAALVGAGGLGDPILRGVSTVNNQLILLGAVPAALLAIIVDKFIGLCENVFISKGLQLKNKK